MSNTKGTIEVIDEGEVVKVQPFFDRRSMKQHLDSIKKHYDRITAVRPIQINIVLNTDHIKPQ